MDITHEKNKGGGQKKQDAEVWVHAGADWFTNMFLYMHMILHQMLMAQITACFLTNTVLMWFSIHYLQHHISFPCNNEKDTENNSWLIRFLYCTVTVPITGPPCN